MHPPAHTLTYIQGSDFAKAALRKLELRSPLDLKVRCAIGCACADLYRDAGDAEL